jgi:hypothetical protein
VGQLRPGDFVDHPDTVPEGTDTGSESVPRVPQASRLSSDSITDLDELKRVYLVAGSPTRRPYARADVTGAA